MIREHFLIIKDQADVRTDVDGVFFSVILKRVIFLGILVIIFFEFCIVGCLFIFFNLIVYLFIEVFLGLFL